MLLGKNNEWASLQSPDQWTINSQIENCQGARYNADSCEIQVQINQWNILHAISTKGCIDSFITFKSSNC